MTRRISLTITAVGAALMLAVPVAWGDNGSAEPARIVTDAFERGLAGEQAGWAAYRDTFERYVTQKQGPVGSSGSLDSYADSASRTDVGHRYTPVAAPASGSEIEWPQLGIGFGVGLLLALGLVLTVRMTRTPLAH
jgi:hypothetical protein